MATATDGQRSALPDREGAGNRRRTGEWVLRAIVGAHVFVIFGQPVFAGVYLSGDYDGLRWHAAGANIVTSIGYVQLVAAIVIWVRGRVSWPFHATLALVVAETVQYLAGQDGALWLHLPLGVMTIAGLVVLFIAVWRRPLRLRPRPPRTRSKATAAPERRETGDE
ncbi:hypothetical protein [Actinomadura roseirufa]|uniref:hypothetical protein n=1 Tax=Actinomadura roseirufa TaxID=2094049 RepID=UPI001A955829|nr:hypothetical protein [Actinomadura roseirufa]